MSILPGAVGQSGVNALQEVEFSALSQRDPNPLGEKALAINPDQWKHGETEHFIYHFVHSYVATPVSVEAEFHYRVVSKELERDQPLTDTKSHVYIFERPEDWAQFQNLGELEKWTGGIHSTGSLFIVRNPKERFSGNVLGHEIVHLVLHRFYADGIPCWLNEGIAQYISKAAHASYQRARGYILPEVSLVCILDADKEGFLRSQTSLIQTAGRAARHINGEVVLFADQITKSMEALISISEYRRTKQMEYNEKHGITPQTVRRAVQESLHTILRGREIESSVIREAGGDFNVTELLRELEDEMQRASANLEFERAALLRDQIMEVKSGAGIAKIEPKRRPVKYTRNAGRRRSRV